MSRITPWAGWIGAIAGWFVSQQAASSFAQVNCVRASDVWIVSIGVAGAASTILGGLISWRVRRAEDAGSWRFIAGTAALASLVFLLAIVFQTLASLIIPQCHA